MTHSFKLEAITLANGTVDGFRFVESEYAAAFGRATEKNPTFKNGEARESVAVAFDLRTLPVESIEFVLAYGLNQQIADGAAGSEDLAGYRKGLNDRVAKLKAGDFTRKTGEGRGPAVDTEESLALKIALDGLKKQVAAAGLKADAKALKEAAAKLVAADPKYRAQAAKELKARASIEVGDDIMAAIMAGMAGATEG